MYRLRNTIRPYAWGSRTVIAELQGRPSPSSEPEAELWIGAHPGAPSQLLSGRSGVEDGAVADAVGLDDVITADPESLLGVDVVAQFGVRLPYLLKFLAVERTLSLQAHPDASQAAAGFAAEEAAGVPRDAQSRCYPDPTHKPELLVAVSEFEALCGFRPPGEAATILAAFNVPALDPVIEALRGTDAELALRDAVHLLMAWPQADRGKLVDAMASATGDMGDTAAAEPVAAAYGLVSRLAAAYPQDVGVVVAVLLNHVRLQPGEAIWIPAGNLHLYLHGAGLEIMAASDNVLRGGLTAKHVDVDELLRVLHFEVLSDPVVRQVSLPDADPVSTWPAPVAEFRLVGTEVGSGATTDLVTLPADGPRSIICTRGEVRLRVAGESLVLRAGEAAFVPATVPAVEVSGAGAVFQAGTP